MSKDAIQGFIKIAWKRLAQYAATRSPIAAIGSSPDKAFARSFTLHARPRAKRAATSCPAVILPTVRAVLSLSTSSSPLKSSQNGIFTSLPPELPTHPVLEFWLYIRSDKTRIVCCTLNNIRIKYLRDDYVTDYGFVGSDISYHLIELFYPASAFIRVALAGSSFRICPCSVRLNVSGFHGLDFRVASTWRVGAAAHFAGFSEKVRVGLLDCF